MVKAQNSDLLGLVYTGTRNRCSGVDLLIPKIHKQILPTDLQTFPYRIGWENLIKDQRNFILGIITNNFFAG